MKTRSLEEISNFHKKRLEILVNHPGTDYLTRNSTKYDRNLYHSGLDTTIESKNPVMVSFSCNNSTHICSGEKFGDAVAAVDKYEQVAPWEQIVAHRITYLD